MASADGCCSDKRWLDTADWGHLLKVADKQQVVPAAHLSTRVTDCMLLAGYHLH